MDFLWPRVCVKANGFSVCTLMYVLLYRVTQVILTYMNEAPILFNFTEQEMAFTEIDGSVQCYLVS